jgi:pimeloyl-ACP methyl ester carboxylesterase
VVIPRLARHGYRDRLSRDHARLSRKEYVSFANEAADLGLGVGRTLIVAGLSVSGVLAAWCAQHRPDVDLAVMIAPAFAPFRVTLGLAPALSQLLVRLPNLFIWWDPRQRARLGPDCSYPRFSTHAMAEAFLLGAEIARSALDRRPECKSILSITNQLDPAVNNAATRIVLTRWREHGASVHQYQFGRELGRLHDSIGPYQPKARPDVVYPILFDQIDSVCPPPRLH